jgi:polyhydroxyalkanoate synthesis regulator phasin
MAMGRTNVGSGKVRRAAAGAVLAGVLGVGGLAVAALNPLGPAGAQDGATTTIAPAAGASEQDQGQGRRGRRLQEVMDSLVADGTLTRAQADAVTTRLKEAAGEARGERSERRRERRQEMLAVAAPVLDMTTEELAAALKDGRTLGQVAEARDVEPQAVIDALVAAGEARIDEAVSAGELEEARATQLEERLADRVERLVEEGGRRR